jgi:hypothetical protein
MAVGDECSEEHNWWWRFQQLEPHVVPPGTIDIEFDRIGLADDLEISGQSVALYFRDANGQWWRRTVKGQLEVVLMNRERLDRATIAQGGKWNRIPPNTTASDALEAFRSK